MKTIQKTLLAFAAIALLASCTEVIDLELNEGEAQRLVVNGWFTDVPGRSRVDLTLTTSYFQNEAAPRVSGALVSVTDGTTTWTLSEVSPGVYQPASDVVGEPGNTYTLNIEHEGENYEASAFMRASNPMDSINVRILDPLEEFGFPADPYYSVRLWTQEPEGLGDAYVWYTYVNGEGIRDTLNELTIVEDSFYDGSYVSDLEIDFVDIETEAVQGDTLLLEQWNIGIDSYEVLQEILNQTDFQGGIFDAPPANVRTNISNGALGLWGAATIVTKETIITE
ncbi:MAG: DUF4249 domain-containing protein [Flavobacteriales bacterium]|nr:DUF4249 domain-containing protein [Flavobacteriales bacterium]